MRPKIFSAHRLVVSDVFDVRHHLYRSGQCDHRARSSKAFCISATLRWALFSRLLILICLSDYRRWVSDKLSAAGADRFRDVWAGATLAFGLAIPDMMVVAACCWASAREQTFPRHAAPCRTGRPHRSALRPGITTPPRGSAMRSLRRWWPG